MEKLSRKLLLISPDSSSFNAAIQHVQYSRSNRVIVRQISTKIEIEKLSVSPSAIRLYKVPSSIS